jgi:hypothetical protein
MDIHEILTQKPHNPHYLSRYIKFIKYCQSKNYTQYTERHHICPKSLFPEYKSFSDHPWNMVVLTYRQHIIAHTLLLKTYNTRCQALSVLLTHSQKHAKSEVLKSSRMIEHSKKILSDSMKGIFTRGYDESGKPIIADETRKKLSDAKKHFYSNPENRKKQSLACTGTSGRKSENYKIAAQNRTEDHIKNLSLSLKNMYANKTVKDRKKINSGIYVTPIGNFTSTDLHRYCKSNDKIITSHSCKGNSATNIWNKSVIGMTPRELGFHFIPKNHHELKEYCVGLNQAHLPEPNHPLASELSDYLSHKKILL